MSSMGAWSYTDTLTIWKVSFDEFSQAAYAAPYTIIGSWESGGETQSAMSGAQFVPVSTYYFEAADGSDLIPAPQDYILRGDHMATADPTSINAEKIKKVGGWSMSMFGATELPDWVIYS